MKKIFLALLQLVLFLLVFLVGSLLDPFHLQWFVSHPTPISTRYFVPDGLLLTVALLVVILAIETAVKKLRSFGTITAVTFALALAAGLLAKFGWVTHDLF